MIFYSSFLQFENITFILFCTVFVILQDSKIVDVPEISSIFIDKSYPVYDRNSHQSGYQKHRHVP